MTRRPLLDALRALALYLLAPAAFALCVWLAQGPDGRAASAADWIYAACLSGALALGAFCVDAVLRRARAREAGERARALADDETRRLRDAWREERRDRSDARAYWVHEFKTPLTALRLALAAGAGDGDAAFRSTVEAELGRLERALELSLFESRAESFDRDYVIAQADVRRACSSAAASLAGAFNAAGVAFFMDDFSLTASSDPRWLEFVLKQLLLNAIKHSPPGGRVRIGALVDRDPAAPGGVAPGIYVDDEGSGIPAEDLSRVFDRGFTGSDRRAAAGVARVPGATGMGLYLARTLCERLGHGLRAENRAAGGCRFVVTFPPSTGHYDPAVKLTKP